MSQGLNGNEIRLKNPIHTGINMELRRTGIAEAALPAMRFDRLQGSSKRALQAMSRTRFRFHLAWHDLCINPANHQKPPGIITPNPNPTIFIQWTDHGSAEDPCLAPLLLAGLLSTGM